MATKKDMTTNFFSPLSLLLFLDPGSGMGKNQDPGSGMNIPDPQHWLQGSFIDAAVVDPCFCLYRHAFWLDIFVDSFVVVTIRCRRALSHWSHALHQHTAVLSRHAFWWSLFRRRAFWLVAFSPARFLIGRSVCAGAFSYLHRCGGPGYRHRGPALHDQLHPARRQVKLCSQVWSGDCL